jgi:hypothetical protein
MQTPVWKALWMGTIPFKIAREVTIKIHDAPSPRAIFSAFSGKGMQLAAAIRVEYSA